ncbi:hypothetical protein [Paenibacillus sp. 22594]
MCGAFFGGTTLLSPQGRSGSISVQQSPLGCSPLVKQRLEWVFPQEGAG